MNSVSSIFHFDLGPTEQQIKVNRRVKIGFPKWTRQFGLGFLQITKNGPKLKGLGQNRLIDPRFVLGLKVGVGASPDLL